MRIYRELKPENLFTVAGSSRGVRWLRADGMDSELSLNEFDAEDLAEFFANLAKDIKADYAS